ncbi:MAG: YeeE/YedE family protein [Gemmatimonadetes bacterium]|nr:YeeE/YedE family protein [Gemmatimonadota bacterium]
MEPSSAWPWFVAGPLIGLVVPVVYLYGGRKWGVSSTFRDICAATAPSGLDYFRYAWRKEGGWRLAMALGLIGGGALAHLWRPVSRVTISPNTRADLAALGLDNLSGLAPVEVFSWSSLMTVPGIFMILVGGFLVGFGTRYANGCTSGHAISGLASFRMASFVAVIGFFIGGLLTTHVLLPAILGGAS